ncbi:LacI family DNA-binding transcriptional regulator [Peribacillus psychrosaccharolyticus]|uniref:LacI family DNA-binding transcriptional regulator n=1 Tax=Peribacillus psychrosaccharolyticus TaxID=1407 RepID=A0A974S2V4_PERPY|nr:LacI family DNA-binding transcriptional regulator [Peribacillus psychrosaccharolyticus]MEC2057690.1 LacI family DNA-binding transcriptional regulator [Peribacillus psychrosaccharolyticus]MED3746380.1 LacI family DNA-binding transcriptional regulator [Peribacillus psychrosaccharolyticus]QQT01945.1 LacI family DNA-binding transcriptional regulator [Peribacillus psychrosaccharolyticus]
MKPTIYDIAREAEVSATTVSKVINNTGRISVQTKKKILKIMEDLHYQPNMLASAMKGKKTYTIGMLIPNMDNPIYSEYLKFIESYGRELGFSIVMCNTSEDPEKEAKHITLLRKKSVDGFIITSKFKNEEVLKGLIDDKIPLVLFAYERPEHNIDCVVVDDYHGGFKVTEYLLSLGHRRIGVIAEDALSSVERVRGYQQALINANVEFHEDLIFLSHSTIDEAKVQAGKLLDKQERPTAIFGCNDMLAVGTLMAAKNRGIAIPKELSVIGFDNTYMCKIVEPQLSSVAMPLQEMGKQTLDLLIQEIENVNNLKHRILMRPNLVIRDSTAELRSFN